jgi:VWFA-related protein
MIGSNGFTRLSARDALRLGVWLFACLLWIAGPQVEAQDGQRQVPNAPGTNMADAGQNGASTPNPQPQQGQQPGEGNPTPSSLNLPNLLHGVTPGEGAPPPTSSSATPAPEDQTNPSPAQPQTAPSNGPAPVIPPKGEGPSVATYTVRTRVNFVLVPVTVKDSHGALLPGLTYNDFQIYEDGVQQRITFFSEDPFPLSVAFVVDQNLPSDTMKKVNDALSAFQGAFAPYDEVAVYTYATHVSQASGFTGAQSARLAAALDRVKSPGRYMEVPSNTGAMAEGPSINGQMVDPNVMPMGQGNFIGIIPKEVHVLNDAILRAATDLSQRGRGRRKMIYVISDGKNQGSTASYKEVVRYLLTNQIAVDGTLVGDSALPVYGFLDRFHIPWQMADNLLPKYASATGGILDAELSRNAIEASFARVAGQVRNQYTLGYYSHISVLDSRFRKIEVRVLLPNVQVIAKQGYYPLATANQ